MKNFGEFYNNQVEHASSIILSHTAGMDEEKLEKVVELLREHNDHAVIITTDWDALDGKQILAAMERRDTIEEALHHLEEEHEHDHNEHEHHRHDHDHEHHDHHHDHDHDEHEHHHDHDHDDHCCCGHDHDHEGHHHADEVFDSIGVETTKKFTIEKIREVLEAIEDQHEYGFVLRAKGIVEGADGQWIHFDYVPGEPDVRNGSAEVTGRICVIGTDIDEDKIRQLFQV